MVAEFMTIIVGVFGSMIGSFLNVVAYRVPLGRSIVAPPSACPGCGARIRAFDNIPVVSWLLLHGKCRNCRMAISVRYPLVELGTALLFAAVAWWYLAQGRGVSVASALELVALLTLAGVSVALALIDLDTRTLPNRIVLPSYVVAAVLLGAAGILRGDFAALSGAAIGMAALWLAYFLMAVVYPGGMGLGDVKLAGLVGLYLGYLGWAPLIVGAFAAFVLGGLFALGLILTRKATRKSGIPFGPWMLAGAWVGILFGVGISNAYLALFGLAS